MDFTEIEPALAILLTNLSGVPTYWEDQPRTWVPNTYALISFKSTVGRGTDYKEWRYSALNPPGAEIREEISGNRNFTLSIRIEALSFLPSSHAWTIIEAIRSGMKLEETTELLNELEVGFIEVLSADVVNYTVDDRKRNVAVMDLRMNTVSRRTGASETYIETFEVMENYTL